MRREAGLHVAIAIRCRLRRKKLIEEKLNLSI